MTQALIYRRMAVADDFAMQGQTAACYELARSHSLSVVGEYVDVGPSGSTRPALTDMLARVAQGGIGAVVVTDTARLSRKFAEVVRIADQLAADGCVIVSRQEISGIARNLTKAGLI